MSTYRDKFIGDLKIKENSSISGQVHGKVTVLENINLQLHGVIVGDLVLHEGAEVFISIA